VNYTISGINNLGGGKRYQASFRGHGPAVPKISCRTSGASAATKEGGHDAAAGARDNAGAATFDDGRTGSA
jgi:hypothetical protein